ncbi:MAG: hypothetical protein PHF06_13170 [Sphaerochaeta sp.]|uniref:hypothetical protein n=1 Tax=Sphaerochaeta sp. TaxID=1972642 RepID=UPI00259040A1|nr:hypothetical protein [Sphaerochaeta sp.]MDD3424605.1 hypothetical protein [Sphaerochaeta sp.]MDD4039326.1 hypothetical protein [Sphaerochaeta sp.]
MKKLSLLALSILLILMTSPVFGAGSKEAAGTASDGKVSITWWAFPTFGQESSFVQCGSHLLGPSVLLEVLIP